jgi:hypothetical protein
LPLGSSWQGILNRDIPLQADDGGDLRSAQ